MKKVNYADYEGKYDENIKEMMKTAPEEIDVETMRANLYGFTFTQDYADLKIPDEFSMDYWQDYNTESNFGDMDDLDLPPIDEETNILYPEDADGPYYFVSPQEELLLKAIDSTGDGKTPQTALCVIDVFQEYEYINRVVEYCDKQVVEQSVRDGIDCLKLKSFDGSIVKLYFDVKRRFEVGYPKIDDAPLTSDTP